MGHLYHLNVPILLKKLMKTKKGNLEIYFIIVIALVVLDQVTKILIKNYFGVYHTENSLSLSRYDYIRVFGEYVQFTYVENEGMAFGISFGAGKYLLSLFSVFASIALIWFIIKIRLYSPWVKIGFSLILAGAVGNLIDRVFYGVIFNYAPLFWGRVIDFVMIDIPDIDLGFIYYTHFPVFNVADSCVTIGVIILIIFHNKIPAWSDIMSKTNNAQVSSSNYSNNTTDIVDIKNDDATN